MNVFRKNVNKLQLFPWKYFLILAVSCFYDKTLIAAQSLDNNTTQPATDQSRLVSTNYSLLQLPCQFAPGLVPGDEARVEQCCNETVAKFESSWSSGNLYLTNYLETLREWKCPQFPRACREKLFSLNEYTRLVYKYFCEYDVFVSECIDVVNRTYVNWIENKVNQSKAVKNQSLNDVTIDLALSKEDVRPKMAVSKSINSTWLSLVKALPSQRFTSEQLAMPCLQVALYQAEGAVSREYHEVIRFNLPSCGVTWCGYNGETVKERIISTWTCLSTSCRAKMVSIIAMVMILAVIVTLANSTVILVYTQNPTLLHSQGIYKLSLAIADLLVGLVVFPTFGNTLLRLITARHELGNWTNVTGYIINESMWRNETVEILNPRDGVAAIFDRDYFNAVGFFTVISFLVSVYTLAVAGFDRFQAVYRPLSYRKDRAKSRAKIFCVVMWLVAFFFAILPMFTYSLRYGLVASILISSGGSGALILYTVGFAIPLLVMWIINSLTYSSTKKHAQVRRHLTMDSKRKSHGIEVRLARTLSLMVGAFSLSIVPAAIVILASFFAPSIYFTRPRTLNLTSALVYNSFEFATIIILACNSLWNFFIYSARNFDFRKATKIAYRDLAKNIGLTRCCSNFIICARRVAHDGRRRISSIPNLTTSAATRKKSSLFSTSLTTISTERKLKQASAINSVSTLNSVAQVVAENSMSNSSNLAETSVGSGTKSYKPVYEKKQKRKKIDEDTAPEDSIFQSFAIDANADRLFVSVMENINEEITEEGSKNEEAENLNKKEQTAKKEEKTKKENS